MQGPRRNLNTDTGLHETRRNLPVVQANEISPSSTTALYLPVAKFVNLWLTSSHHLGVIMRLRAAPQPEKRGTEGGAVASPVRGEYARPGMRLKGSAGRPKRDLLPGERWFAVQCQAHREAFAANQLRAQGFTVFLPLRPKTWRHARRLETRHVAFFPGYLFLVLDLDQDRWRSVNGTIGVKRLVMVGGAIRPMALPPGIIEALLCQADDRGCLRPGGPLRIGQNVRILAGPFGDLLGELIELDENGRVRVLIELLGARVPAALSRGEVVAAR